MARAADFNYGTILFAGWALSSLVAGCDIDGARLLQTTFAKGNFALHQGAPPKQGTARTEANSKEGGSHKGHQTHRIEGRPEVLISTSQSSTVGLGTRIDTSRSKASETPTNGIDQKRAAYLLDQSPWFGRGQAGLESGSRTHCENGKCHEQPRCYPGTRPEFVAEQAAITQHPLRTVAALEGKWLCASGQGYLAMKTGTGGLVSGVIVLTNQGQELPIKAFNNGVFSNGKLSFGAGGLEGVVGQVQKGGPKTFTAVAHGPDGERLVRFTLNNN